MSNQVTATCPHAIAPSILGRAHLDPPVIDADSAARAPRVRSSVDLLHRTVPILAIRHFNGRLVLLRRAGGDAASENGIWRAGPWVRLGALELLVRLVARSATLVGLVFVAWSWPKHRQ